MRIILLSLKKLNQIMKLLNLKLKITKYKNNFSKCNIENCLKEIFVIESLLKTDPSTYKVKDLDGETMIESFL